MFKVTLHLLIVAGLMIGLFQSSVHSQNTSEPTALLQLVETYNISLDDNQKQTVANHCQTVISDSVKVMDDQLTYKKQQYKTSLVTIKEKLILIQSNLENMGINTEAIQTVNNNFMQIETSLLDSLTAYEFSLSEIINLKENCQDYPLAFIAGLKEVNNRRLLVITNADNFIEFVNTELKLAFQNINQSLIDTEENDA